MLVGPIDVAAESHSAVDCRDTNRLPALILPLNRLGLGTGRRGKSFALTAKLQSLLKKTATQFIGRHSHELFAVVDDMTGSDLVHRLDHLLQHLGDACSDTPPPGP